MKGEKYIVFFLPGSYITPCVRWGGEFLFHQLLKGTGSHIGLPTGDSTDLMIWVNSASKQSNVLISWSEGGLRWTYVLEMNWRFHDETFVQGKIPKIELKRVMTRLFFLSIKANLISRWWNGKVVITENGLKALVNMLYDEEDIRHVCCLFEFV